MDLVWNAKPDGLTWLQSNAGRALVNIIRPKGLMVKLEEMPAILGTPSGVAFFTKPDMIREPKDIVTAKGLIFGATDPTKAMGGAFFFSKEILGIKPAKEVFGYGTAGLSLAFLSGEINLWAASAETYYGAFKAYLDRGEAIGAFQSGILDSKGNIVRGPEFSDIPTMNELYQQIYGKPVPPGPFYECYLMVMRSLMWTTHMTPGTPQRIVDVVRKATVDMVNDPAFRKDAALFNPTARFFVGDELDRLMPLMFATPPEVVQIYIKYLQDHYGATVSLG